MILANALERIKRTRCFGYVARMVSEFILQNMVRSGEISLSDRSAGAAIGWLIFLLTEKAKVHPNLISLWGIYNAESKGFKPVSGLQEKLDACKEDGIRTIAVPKATLDEPVGAGTFNSYAQQRQMHLIPFPDDMPISDVYLFILGKCYEREVIADQPDTRDPFFSPSGRNKGELLREGGVRLYWGQHNKKFYVPNVDIVKHMVLHKMPGWNTRREMTLIPHLPGPSFYYKDSRSDGLLIINPTERPVFLIHNGHEKTHRCRVT